MIKFFRKIRKKLLTENKFSKYLLYAIGEIILVVIGILIALSINNWNEERKQELDVRSYLERVAVDLALDMEFFSKQGENLNYQIAYFKSISKGNFSEVDLSDFHNKISWNSDPRVFSQSYRSLEKNGKLSYISNTILLDSLRIYFDDRCLVFNDWADWHKNFVVQNIEGYVMHNLPLVSAEKTDTVVVLAALKQGELISIVNKQLKSAIVFKGLMQTNKQMADNTKQMIEVYLGRVKE